MSGDRAHPFGRGTADHPATDGESMAAAGGPTNDGRARETAGPAQKTITIRADTKRPRGFGGLGGNSFQVMVHPGGAVRADHPRPSSVLRYYRGDPMMPPTMAPLPSTSKSHECAPRRAQHQEESERSQTSD